MGSRYSLEAFGKTARDVEYGDRFEIGGQLVIVELVEKSQFDKSDSDHSFLVRRVLASENDTMKLVCSADTPITVFKTQIAHNVESQTISKEEVALDILDDRINVLTAMHKQVVRENADLRRKLEVSLLDFHENIMKKEEE
jgi:hypothetical protein